MKTLKILLLFLLVFPTLSMAQAVEVRAKPLTDDDIKLLRQDVQDFKDDIIAHTMQFSSAESEMFWPVYREYARQQHAIADKRLRLITEYAQNIDKMTDANASSLTTRLFAVEDETQALRRGFFPKFEKALGAKRAAKFYQVDNRLTMVINIQLASEVPLIP